MEIYFFNLDIIETHLICYYNNVVILLFFIIKGDKIMAIFSCEKKTNDEMLDFMYEACEDMLDILDEHGGARKRYVDMKEREGDYHDSRAIDMRRLGHEDLAKKHIKATNKAWDEADKYAYKNRYNKDDHYESTMNKRQFMKDFGGPEGTASDKRINSRKPNQILNMQNSYKKKQIKETCYMILDMIDEI